MKQFILKYRKLILQMLLVIVMFAAGLIFSDDVVLRFWSSMLIANWFILLISVSGIFLMSLHYLTGAKWSEPLLPILRELKKGIPFLSVTFLLMLAGSGYLFKIGVQNKYNIIGIAIWSVAASALLFFVYFFDDIFRKRKFTEKQRSIIELIVLIPALYIYSKVWIRDLYPIFSNPVFVFYIISSSLLSGLSVVAILFIKGWDNFIESNKKIIFYLGRYLMAIVMIRGYLWFTQYLIIYYAGISNETELLSDNVFLIGYNIIGMLFSFLIPFVFLVFRKVKENPKYLYHLAVLILIGQYFDLYYLIYQGASVANFRLSLIDISVFFGFMLVYMGYMRSKRITI